MLTVTIREKGVSHTCNFNDIADIPMSVGAWRHSFPFRKDDDSLRIDVADMMSIKTGSGSVTLYGGCATVSMLHSTVLSLI